MGGRHTSKRWLSALSFVVVSSAMTHRWQQREYLRMSCRYRRHLEIYQVAPTDDGTSRVKGERTRHARGMNDLEARFWRGPVIGYLGSTTINI